MFHGPIYLHMATACTVAYTDGCQV